MFVDSPLAVGATTIFNEHYKDCFDEEAMERWSNKGINPIAFPGFETFHRSRESKSINFVVREGHYLLRGMCDAGRINIT